jgi:methanogenic corrinoid protein MtbC1
LHYSPDIVVIANSPPSDEKRHPIRVAANRSGLTPELLRAWELRYGAIEPGRSDSGQRRYSDQDVERLRLLRRVTEAGRRIGDVAIFPMTELADLAKEDRRSAQPAVTEAGPVAIPARAFLIEAMRAIESMDQARLRRVFTRAAVALTPPALLEDVVTPLLRRVGEQWEQGTVDPSDEHMATVVVQGVLSRVLDAVSQDGSSWRLVVATPTGQRHEIGAMIAAITAAVEGWNVIYLGADLPAPSIAEAARRKGARIVALSLVYPANDPSVSEWIHSLGRTIEEGIDVLAGGEAANSYGEDLSRIGATVLTDMTAFRSVLRSLQAGV